MYDRDNGTTFQQKFRRAAPVRLRVLSADAPKATAQMSPEEQKALVDAGVKIIGTIGNAINPTPAAPPPSTKPETDYKPMIIAALIVVAAIYFTRK